MDSWSRCALIIACAAAAARASPAPVASPAITPAALLPRVNVRTLGFYSTSTDGESTKYLPWTFDADATTYTTSSSWFRRCAVGSTCVMYTECSDGYMIASDTSTSCGAGGGGGTPFCSNHVLFPTEGATEEFSWFWCDTAPLTGYTFYEQEPVQTFSSSEPASTDASTTASSPSSGSSSVSQTASTTTPIQQSTSPASGGGSSNTGAIAGGVVGGIAGVALVGAGIFFFLYRRKKQGGAAAQQPPAGYAVPPNQPQGPYQPSGYPASPNMGYATAYQSNEAKPQGVEEMGGFYGQQQQQPAAYPQGPYDPHMSQYGSPQPQYGSPQQQYGVPQAQPQPQAQPASPQELPVQK